MNDHNAMINEMNTRFEIVQKEIQSVSEQLSKKIYNDFILPFCMKWALLFDTGMGVWTFTGTTTEGNRHYVDVDTCKTIQNYIEADEDDFWDEDFPTYRKKEFLIELLKLERILDHSIKLYDFDAFSFVPNVTRANFDEVMGKR